MYVFVPKFVMESSILAAPNLMQRFETTSLVLAGLIKAFLDQNSII